MYTCLNETIDIASTLFLLRHFGHLSHIGIKISHNNINQLIFLDVMTELT